MSSRAAKQSRRKRKQATSPFEEAVKYMAKENYKKEKLMKEEVLISFRESREKLDSL